MNFGGLESSFRVGTKHRCRMRFITHEGMPEVIELRCEWDPERPASLSPAMRRDYRRGRDGLLEEAARHFGLNIICAELGGGPIKAITPANSKKKEPSSRQ